MPSLADVVHWANRIDAFAIGLFPLAQFRKEPPIVAGFQYVATKDPNILGGWWRKPEGGEHDYNIGLLTTGMVVVDIDLKKQASALNNFYELGGRLDDTLVTQTPTGGYHVFYRGPDSACAVNIVPGIDIRSHNGYVVLPPSEIMRADLIGAYTVYHDADVLAYVPPRIASLLKRPNARKTDRPEYTEHTDSHASVSGFISFIRGEIELAQINPQEAHKHISIQGHGGSNCAFIIAAWGTHNYGLSEAVCFDILSREWNEMCQPPWSSEELITHIENANQYGKDQKDTFNAPVLFNGVTVLPPDYADPVQHPDYEPVGNLQWGNVVSITSLAPIRWLVPDYLVRGVMTLGAGPGGVGKTTLAMLMACAMACGKTVGSFNPVKPFRVVVHDDEDPIEYMTARLYAICQLNQFPIDLVKSNIALVGRQPRLRVNESWDETIDKLISKFPGLDTLILNPLSSLHDADENQNTEMRHVMARIDTVAAKYDISVLAFHHFGKAGTKRDANSLRGASAITNTPRIVFSVTEADREKYGPACISVDIVKSNLSATKGTASSTFRIRGIFIRGSSYAAMTVANPEPAAYEHPWMNAIRDYMLDEENTSGSLKMADAIRLIKSIDKKAEVTSDHWVRSIIQGKLPYKVVDNQARVAYINTAPRDYGNQPAVLIIIAGKTTPLDPKEDTDVTSLF